ncbi:MAG: beta-keto acid cleavage family enzyme [Nitrososphaerales archaeon]
MLTAALTGSIHTPTMSPHLPITPEQIADEAVRAYEAGASIVHVHVRNPSNGQPVSDIELFRKVLSSIKEKSDVIVNITTGGGLGMSAEDRIKTISNLKPEMASLNMGSMNFGLFPALKRFNEWKFPWEPQYLEGTRDLVFRNTFADIAYFCKTMYENDVKPELECYDVGHIYNLRQLIDDGKIRTPVHLQFVLGITGGIGASLEELIHMRQTADRVIGQSNYTFSVCAAGRMQFSLCVASSVIGGHVRVGLEDNLYLGKGVLAKSNGELVAKIRSLVYDITGREVASVAETRNLLGLKGKSKTNF